MRRTKKGFVYEEEDNYVSTINRKIRKRKRRKKRDPRKGIIKYKHFRLPPDVWNRYSRLFIIYKKQNKNTDKTFREILKGGILKSRGGFLTQNIYLFRNESSTKILHDYTNGWTKAKTRRKIIGRRERKNVFSSCWSITVCVFTNKISEVWSGIFSFFFFAALS